MKVPIRKFYWTFAFVELLAITSSASRNALGILNIVHAGSFFMTFCLDYSYWKNEMLNNAKNIAEKL